MDKASLVGSIAWWDRARIVFGVIAALGTVSVIAIQIWLMKLNGSMSVIKDAEAEENRRQMASLTTRSQEAEARIADAGREIAIAQRSAAEADARAQESKKIAEGERLARVKIEERMAPRRLVHPERLVAALAPFKNDGSTDERLTIDWAENQETFAQVVLHTVFQAVHWGVQAGGPNISLPSGATLYVAPDASDVTRKRAQALADGLRAAGMSDLVGPTSGSPTTINGPDSKIKLMVGAR